MIKNCVVCQTEFEALRKTVTCSPECHNKLEIINRNKLNELNKSVDKSKTCPRCGHLFMGKVIGGPQICRECYDKKEWTDNRKGEHHNNYHRMTLSRKSIWSNYTISPNPEYKKIKNPTVEHTECWHCGKLLVRDSFISSHVAICLDCMTMTDIYTGLRFNGRVEVRLTRKYYKHMIDVKATRSRVDGGCVDQCYVK